MECIAAPSIIVVVDVTGINDDDDDRLVALTRSVPQCNKANTQLARPGYQQQTDHRRTTLSFLCRAAMHAYQKHKLTTDGTAGAKKKNSLMHAASSDTHGLFTSQIHIILYC